MIVPKTFQLGGRTWTVEHVNGRSRRGSTLGKTDTDKCRIRIFQCKTDEERQHTFMHELVHAVMWTIGREKLFDDENFVDATASLLLQALETSRG